MKSFRFTVGLHLGLLALVSFAARAQAPNAPAGAKPTHNASPMPSSSKVNLPAIPGMGPAPVLPAHPTAAQTADYQRQMAERTRQRWNFILTDSLARARMLNEAPNALLVETVRGRPPGAALDADMGEGRNAIYLAQQGWQVTGVDVAEKALAYAQKKARATGVKLTTEVHDMATYDWGTNKWDLIVLSYAGGREYADRAQKALKSGGLVVLEAFHLDAAEHIQVVGGDYRVFFKTDELPALYRAAGFTILRYEEPIGTADFTKEKVRLVKMVARKP